MDISLARLRGNKLALYGAAGLVGGALGAAIAELFLAPHPFPTLPGWRLRLITYAGLHEAIVAAILTVALFLAGEWHQRRELKPERLLKILLFGAAAGFVAAAAANFVYTLVLDGFFKFYILRIASWALEGILLGAILSRRIPNLGMARGAVAGGIGGAVGCIGALITWSSLPDSAEFVGRIVGIALLGLAIGLAMHIAETLFREASIEVEWAPNETSVIGLGSTPVTVGGGEDHIFIRGQRPHMSSIVFSNGQIEHIETANGRRTPLDDGSRLRIGGVYMVVHAAK